MQRFKFLPQNHRKETNNTFVLIAVIIWKYANATEWYRKAMNKIKIIYIFISN